MMTNDDERFLSWDEQIISQEKGNRTVHYYLTNSVGDSVLAILGTERSVRHMIYVVFDAFVERYGASCNVNSSTKWRSRREVVDWLTKLVAKNQRLLPPSESLDRGQPFRDRICGSNGSLISNSPVMLPRMLKAQISDIVWDGEGWSCSKKLMHYPSFIRTGITISVHSFVFVMAAEGNHHLGYIEDMYEDKKEQKKVRVRWFHRDEEATSLVSQLDAHPREVFITPHVQVINAECIGGPASVLTPTHYEQCVAALPQSILCRVHMCFRQLKNDQIRPFTVSKLQGYRNQAVLSCIDHILFSNKNQKNKFSGDHIKQGSKRKRLDEGKSGDIKLRGHSRAEKSPSAALGNCKTNGPSLRKLKIKLAGKTVKGGGDLEGSHHEVSASFEINDEIELLCQDSGIRGCWFKCKVLKVSKKHIKVQYDDLEDAEDSGKLQELVASYRVAAPDKLGIRHSGRLTTRPRPPKDPGYCILEVGTAVDIWWNDGWWEGVIIATNVCETDHLQIYLPGEDKYVTTEKSLIRMAKDWVNGSWVNAKTCPDILSFISAKSNDAMPPISEIVEVEGQDVPVMNMHKPVITNIGDKSDNTTNGIQIKEKDNSDVKADEQLVEDLVNGDKSDNATSESQIKKKDNSDVEADKQVVEDLVITNIGDKSDNTTSGIQIKKKDNSDVEADEQLGEDLVITDIEGKSNNATSGSQIEKKDNSDIEADEQLVEDFVITNIGDKSDNTSRDQIKKKDNSDVEANEQLVEDLVITNIGDKSDNATSGSQIKNDNSDVEADEQLVEDLVIANVGDKSDYTTNGSQSNKKGNSDVEADEQLVENLVGYDAGNIAEDNRLNVEKDFEFCRQQFAQAKFVEAGVR